MSASGDESPSTNSMDDVINVYKKDVDRTLLRENLKLTVDERIRKFESAWAYAADSAPRDGNLARRIPVMEPNFREILPLLQRHGVRFILIGGGAAMFHGLARITYDVDVVYARDPENLRSLVAALSPFQPYLRGAPPGLPFRWDERTLKAGLNFTLTTTLGSLDLLGEVAGGGLYEQLLPYTQDVTALGISCKTVTLERLIHLKRAAGRPKDFEAVAELELLLAERQQGDGNH